MSKTQLLQQLAELRTQTDHPLWTWLNTWAKANYEEATFLLDQVEQFAHTLDDTATDLQLLPAWTEDNNAYWGSLITLVVALWQDQPEAVDTVEQEGDLVVTEPTIVSGNLTITGDLKTNYLPDQAIALLVLGDLHIKGNYDFQDSVVVVLGDLIIDGSFREYSDWSLTVVGGNLTVQKWLNSCGDLMVLGKTTSPILSFSYNQGQCVLHKGFDTLVFYESDHGRSLVLGPYTADFIAIDEVQGVASKAGIEAYQQLSALLEPEALGELAEVDWDTFDEAEYGDDVAGFLMEAYDFELLDWMYTLEERAKQGQPVLTAAALEKFRP